MGCVTENDTRCHGPALYLATVNALYSPRIMCSRNPPALFIGGARQLAGPVGLPCQEGFKCSNTVVSDKDARSPEHGARSPEPGQSTCLQQGLLQATGYGYRLRAPAILTGLILFGGTKARNGPGPGPGVVWPRRPRPVLEFRLVNSERGV